MAKRYLLSYTMGPTHFFGDSYEFNFTLSIVKKYWFFGERKKLEEVNYVISMFQSIKQHTDHWDELIRTQKPLK